MLSRDRFAAAVRRRFETAGDVVRPATLTRSEPGTYDPATGTPGAAIATADNGLALFDRGARAAEELGGLIIEPNEETLWLAGLSLAPRAGDVVTIDGVARTVRHARDLSRIGALHLIVAR